MCDKMRKISNWSVTESDLDIFSRYLKGDKPAVIAADAQISRQYVYNIVNKVRVFRGDDVYEDPYDLRYLPALTARTRTILEKRGVKNIKELAELIRRNRLISIPGIGDLKEKKILIQFDNFMYQRRKAEQNNQSK